MATSLPPFTRMWSTTRPDVTESAEPRSTALFVSAQSTAPGTVILIPPFGATVADQKAVKSAGICTMGWPVITVGDLACPGLNGRCCR